VRARGASRLCPLYMPNGKAMPRRRMTLREYARSRGYSPSSVSQALREHRLTAYSATWDAVRGCWTIDPAKADEEWARHTFEDWGGRRPAAPPR
jgi:hypothetical protein